MATTYQLADDDVTSLVARIVEENHPELHEAGVRFGVLFAENPNGDPIKAHGYPALACVRVVPLKDRVTKGFDAEILIDRGAWDRLGERHKAAVVDHEATHVVRVPNSPKAIKAGEAAWKLDDLGRPKLKLRKGDLGVGDAFAEVIARHGDFAVEYLNINKAKAFADGAKRKGQGEAA